MIITLDGLQDSLFQSDPDTYRRAVKLVPYLEVRDSTGTRISRITRIDTETMESDVVTARVKVPHATLWICSGDDRSEDRQIDKDLKPISKEAE